MHAHCVHEWLALMQANPGQTLCAWVRYESLQFRRLQCIQIYLFLQSSYLLTSRKKGLYVDALRLDQSPRPWSATLQDF